MVVSCGGKQSTAMLGEEPIEKVFRVEDNVDQLGVWSRQKVRADVLIHIDPSEDMTIFPESHAQSMRNAAEHLKRGNTSILKDIRPVVERGGVVNIGVMAGFFKRVIWVVPTESSRSSVTLEEIVRFLLRRGEGVEPGVQDGYCCHCGVLQETCVEEDKNGSRNGESFQPEQNLPDGYKIPGPVDRRGLQKT